MEPKEFRLSYTEYADWRKFKTWMRKVLNEVAEKNTAYDDEALQKFGKEIDLCLGDYDEIGKVNTDIAALKWDYTYFMSEEELKKLKEKPEPIKIPKGFDYSKAERVIITKEDIKRREQEAQSKLKEI